MRRSSLTIEHALLGFLRRQPRHGYAIHQALSDPAGLGPVWQIKLSQLYALLGKLAEAGYVSATTEPQENRPPRKLFHLTGTGESAFLAWVESPVKHGRQLRLEFLAKLYFARREGPDVVRRLVTRQREMCQAWQTAVTDQMADVAEEQPYHRLVFAFRAGQIQAMQEWLTLCEQMLAENQ